MKKKSSKLIHVKINGKECKVNMDVSVYTACQSVATKLQRIPTLCHFPYLPKPSKSCGMCSVEINGTLTTSCHTKIKEGMEIVTNSKNVVKNIRNILKEKLSKHPLRCAYCYANGYCEFQKLLSRYNVSVRDLEPAQIRRYKTLELSKKIYGNNAVQIDRSKCIECYRCVRTCYYMQKMCMLSSQVLRYGKKEKKIVKNYVFSDLEDYHTNMFTSACISCGQCSLSCPVGALTINSHSQQVMKILQSKTIKDIIVCSIAPSVRVTLSEELSLRTGQLSKYQLVSVLRKMGMDYVFDTNFTADLTIMEESHELIKRIEKGGPFPLFTSCCPAWINLIEKQYPHLIKNLSTCKSPQGMMGALVKNYWAKKKGISKKNIVKISIMPCAGKKDERKRTQLGPNDVDYVLTVQELARLINMFDIQIPSKKEVFEKKEKFDSPLGESTGASVIFGTTGGVMEAALRTAYSVVMKKELPKLEFREIRGMKGIKVSKVKMNNLTLKVAVVHQIKNAKLFLRKIKSGEEFHFVEVMACPSGCLGGSGNAKRKYSKLNLLYRMKAIFELDGKNKIRKSHQNKSVRKLYKEYLGEPGNKICHKYLHTHYNDRSNK